MNEILTVNFEDIFEEIKQEPSKNSKLDIIKKYLDYDFMNLSAKVQVGLFKMIIEDCFGPKYNIKKLPEMSVGTKTLKEDYRLFHTLLHRLSSRELTGNEAINATVDIISSFNEPSQKILIGILNHELGIGVSRKGFESLGVLNKANVEVSLAINLDKAKGVNPIDGTYYASRKLDGCRLITYISTEYDDDKLIATPPRFFSRQGKEFKTLDNLSKQVQTMMCSIGREGDWVLDGECCILDENGDEHFDWIMKEITRKDCTIDNPCYCLFDIITEDEFNGEKTSPMFEDRYNTLKLLEKHLNYLRQNANENSYLYPQRIKVLEQERVTSQDVFDKWSKKGKEGNWEGFMLRKNVSYQGGRSKLLLKVKKFQDAEYIIEGVETGKVTYNENGHKEFSAVTNLIFTHKGNRVSVGSGLTKEQRLRWYEHPEEIIGKTATIQYFEETQDSKTGLYSLRFPVLKYVYNNGRDL